MRFDKVIEQIERAYCGEIKFNSVTERDDWINALLLDIFTEGYNMARNT